jgi:hypothetical protein
LVGAGFGITDSLLPVAGQKRMCNLMRDGKSLLAARVALIDLDDQLAFLGYQTAVASHRRRADGPHSLERSCPRHAEWRLDQFGVIK